MLRICVNVLLTSFNPGVMLDSTGNIPLSGIAR